MIILGDKKKTLTQILGPRDEEKVKDPEVSDHDAVASDIINAINDDDAGALASALKTFYTLCTQPEAEPTEGE